MGHLKTSSYADQQEADPRREMKVQFDTSCFLDHDDKSGMWQRFELEMTVSQYRKANDRIDDLEEEASRTGRYAKLRQYERRLVHRFAAGRSWKMRK